MLASLTPIQYPPTKESQTHGAKHFRLAYLPIPILTTCQMKKQGLAARGLMLA